MDYDFAELAATGLIAEAEVLQDLQKHKHPNICEYLGCILESGNRVSGLCLKRYKYTLDQAVSFDLPIDRDTIFTKLSTAISFLHTLGLVHGDINPFNIMIDAENGMDPVIVDFGSCLKEGEPLGRCVGTPYCTMEPPPEIVTRESDLFGLGLIKKFLDGSLEEESKYAFNSTGLNPI